MNRWERMLHRRKVRIVLSVDTRVLVVLRRHGVGGGAGGEEGGGGEGDDDGFDCGSFIGEEEVALSPFDD